MSMPSIVIAGDCCLHGRTALLNASQLTSLLKNDIQPIVQSADYAIVNLETAVFETNLHPIKKAGPALKTDARILEMIRNIGFTGVTLANNHFADYGQQGVEDSLRLLDEYKLWHVGAGMNAEKAAEIGYLQAGDKKIAVVNACEHEFTVATNVTAGCNALDPLKVVSQIMKAKNEADNVVVIIHGGHEHYNLPSPRMQDIYRAFVDFGADAIINHHQHCYSGYELYKGKPIVYGLGNFFFDWPGYSSDWNEGYMVRLTFSDEIEFALIPYIQNAKSLGIRLMNAEEQDKFDKQIANLNNIIVDSKQLQSNLLKWAISREKDYLRMLTPSYGKGVRILKKLNLLSNNQHEYWQSEYFTEERKLLLKSLFQCESHQEIMNILFDPNKQTYIQ